jgi:hypothetical protein
VYYIIEKQFATSRERICVALFDFDPNLTSARGKFLKEFI